MTTRIQRITLLLTLIVATILPSAAQKRSDRDTWDREMTEFRHDFYAKELGLTDKQKTQFFALHDAMIAERRAARREVRTAEKQLKDRGAAATSADRQRVADLKSQLKSKESQIEMKYYEQFKKVLTAEQLLKLPDVDEAFAKLVRNQYRKRKG